MLGKDERGEFYGMARLLRKAIVKKGSIEIPDELDSLSMTPQYPLRGHQLGYRDKNNTYGAWSKKEFEAYIEDLALFGANAIDCFRRRRTTVCIPHFSRKIRWS